MRAVMESSFDSLYLICVLALGLNMILRAHDNRQKYLFGVLSLVLVFGDAFHLLPRVLSLLQNRMEENVVSLGVGKLVTSITMTVFYVLLYHFFLNRYQKPAKAPLSFILYALALCRVILCLFPQNKWLSGQQPLTWGIYRNIPFGVMGLIVVVFLLWEGKRRKDPPFRFAWLAILLSFMFYTPVVLFADRVPAIGMLMLPKTLCYVWLVTMGYRSFRADEGRWARTGEMARRG